MWGSEAPKSKFQDANFLMQVGFALLAIALAYFVFTKKSANLDPKKFLSYKLLSKKELSPNVIVATFELPDKTKPMGLPVGRHIQCRYKAADGEDVIRSYTPSEWRENGKFDILFKVYPKGKMTNHVKNLAIGKTLEIRGPTGRMSYKGDGKMETCSFRGDKKTVHEYTSLILMCGGSGLTPMLQIAKAALSSKTDKTPVYLLFANSTPKDAFYVEELEKMQQKYPDQFTLTLGVSRNPSHIQWDHYVGRFNTVALKEFLANDRLPPVSDTVGTAICGPPGFEKAMAVAIKEVGYNKKIKTMRW